MTSSGGTSNTNVQNATSRAALAFAGVVTAIIVVVMIVHASASQRIAAGQLQLQATRLAEVLPEGPFDTTRERDVLPEDIPGLTEDAPLPIHRFWRNGQPAATIMQVTAPDGYNGDIVLLLGVTTDGVVSGTRVISHRETPGLGDDIELRRSDWITGFDGLSLKASTTSDWAVKKRGGQFDAFTGATITPQAVVLAIHRALLWLERHTDTVYALPRESAS